MEPLVEAEGEGGGREKAAIEGGSEGIIGVGVKGERGFHIAIEDVRNNSSYSDSQTDKVFY